MLRTILCVVLPLAFGTAIAQGDARWQKAEKALARNKAYPVIRISQQALGGKAPDQRFLVLRATARNMIGEHGPALQDAMAARAHVHGDTLQRAALEAGIALVGLGHGDSSRYWFTQAYDGLHGAEARRRVGRLEKMAGRCTEALILFNEALRRTPDDMIALRERGGCHAMNGDTAAARADLDRAIDLAPRDPANWNSRGAELYARTGQWAEAVADYDRAIKLDPNYSFAFNNKGLALHHLGETEKGLKAISIAGKKRPGNPFVPRNLGLIALDLGDTIRACGHLHDALALGFTASYGPEVKDLVARYCAQQPSPASQPPDRQPTTPVRSNAPSKNNAPDRTNAP